MGTSAWVKRSSPGRRLIWTLFLAAMVLPLLLAGTMSAEEQAAAPEPGARERPFQRGDRSERRAEMRKKMLEKFDADEDGKLNEEERAKLREEMGERRGDGVRRGGKRGDRGAKRGRPGKGDRERGPEGRRHGFRDHGGPPDLDKLFEKFDQDGDDRLDREEFKAALHVLREMHERRLGRHDEGRLGGKGPGKGRDGFRRRPRSDREGRPGPPSERGPRPDRDRRDRDERE